MCDLVAIQIDLSCPVIKQDKIVPSAIHFGEAQHAFRLAYLRRKRERAAQGLTASQPSIFDRRLPKPSFLAERAVARSCFGVYLCAGEQALCMDRHFVYCCR